MEKFPKSDFEVKRNTNDSRASRHNMNYLESYKQIIDCGGTGFKNPNFIKCYICVTIFKDMEHR